MAKAFKYGLKGITGYLEPAERELLRSLFDDVVSMLEPAEPANQDPPGMTARQCELAQHAFRGAFTTVHGEGAVDDQLIDTASGTQPAP